MVLLGIFMSMGALVLGNMLHSFVSDQGMIFEDRAWIWERYGTAYRAMYTLFEITFAGNWPVSARPVLNKVSHVYVIFFVLYITLVVFAVIRVISAVFLKVAAYFQTMELDVHEGQALFKVLQNSNGEVTLEEFIDGILRCKGPARAIDQVAMHAELRDIDAKIGRLAALMSHCDTGQWISGSEELGIHHRAEHLKVLRIHDTNA
ncbi:unnamed protein product [Cladocopium goreaui]|uniref:Voltage-dependent T-type calcium channel subunit alpha-1I n=1 Tax=Cladocopium goreaui TaxID=2562237 RepID=A0A9P1DSP4_9DINO|nr:unnamed protein product [Cladocopium goreaui]CAI4015998.1 unnamed protein product [Cladocopium goreaui]